MEKIDIAIRHITAANGNVFADLGFSDKEAKVFKQASQQLIERKLIENSTACKS